MVDLSVVLPAYNERRSVAASVGALARFLDATAGQPGRWTGWEILLVDDGSLDGTAQAARDAAGADARIRVLESGRNTGKGAAVGRGVREAAGRRILITDVDLSYALEGLARAYTELEEGADFVAGDRRHPDSRLDLRISALGHVVRRQAVSHLFNLAVRLCYGLRSRDTQCGLKGFRREAAGLVFSRLRTARFLSDIEMFLIAEGRALKVARIPVHLTYLSADSTVQVLRQAPAVLSDALDILRAQWRGEYRR